jgi:hypothetical protein
VGWLFDRVEAVRVPACILAALAALLCLLPLGWALVRLPDQDLSEDRTAAEFQSALLSHAPQGAVLLSQEDAHTFALWYGQYALGMRADVTTVDLGLMAHGWYVAQISDQLGAPVAMLLAEENGQRQAAERLGRPICTVLSPEPTLVCLHPERVENP